jgi:hypothetical protein
MRGIERVQGFQGLEVLFIYARGVVHAPAGDVKEARLTGKTETGAMRINE